MRAYWVNENHVEGRQLPGRIWKMLINEAVGCRNVTFGIAEFPAGSNPGAHKHDIQEEIIFIMEGAGRMTLGEEEIKLEPGLAIFVPPGMDHAVINDGNETIRLVTLFSPQVIPGSYDRKA